MKKISKKIAEDIKIAKNAAKENIIKSKDLPDMLFEDYGNSIG